MNSANYPLEMFDYLYSEAEYDIIFFGQLIGVVSYDCNDIPCKKNNIECFCDALKLAEYLVTLTDYAIGRTMVNEDESVSAILFKNGFQEFNAVATEIYTEYGIDSTALKVELWLQKIKGRQPPKVLPGEILSLFC
jgi:hypothetical protein